MTATAIRIFIEEKSSPRTCIFF